MRRVAALALAPALAALAVLVALGGCPSQRPTQVGQQPSWRGSAAAPKPAQPIGPVTFAPAGEPAPRYNEPLAAPPPSPLGDAVVAAVTEAAGRAGTPVPVADARLFRACAELAAIVPEEGVVGYSLVEFALQRNGIIEPSPHLLVVWGEIDSPALIVEQLRPRLAEILGEGAHARVGVGAARRLPDGTGAVVFALQKSSVATAPIPRELPAGGAFRIEAVVDRAYRDPDVIVTYEDGRIERVAHTAGHAGSLAADIRCPAGGGRQQVEITASDASGATVLANFPVWCGAAAPRSVTVAPSADDAPAASPQEAERRLLALVNRDRAAHALPPLAWDERVAEVARGHSEDMQRTRNVAHISATTGSASDRVRAAQIKTAVVLENVARAYGLGEAHAGLMNSPGHRANIMSASATHVGIGVVFGGEVSGRRELFITQVFTRVPPVIDPARATAQVLDRLIAARPVAHAAQLASIAQQLADAMAAGKTREQAYPLVKKQVDALGATYARVGSVITAVAELSAIDGAALLGAGATDDVGVGVAQGPHADIGERAIWVVVLLAERR